MSNYYQCKLQRGTMEQTAWCSDPNLRVGVSVMLPADGQFWKVLQVFSGVAMTEEQVKNMQQLHHNSLPSVEGMAQHK